MVHDVYRVTSTCLKGEFYELMLQARRAAVLIFTNLAEGLGRGTSGEQSRFSQIALSPGYERGARLLIAMDLGYLSSEECCLIQEALGGLIKGISIFLCPQGAGR